MSSWCQPFATKEMNRRALACLAISFCLLTLIVRGDDIGNNVSAVQPVIEFSSAKQLEVYQSSTAFDPRGMEHLYMLTNIFLDLVLKEGLPPSIVTEEIISDPVKVVTKNRGAVLSHFIGVICLALCGVALAVLVPLVGLFFCCCRCAGRCGSQRGVLEKSHDPCRRVVYGIFMFLIVLVMLFGLVCSFVTNEYVEHGVHALPVTLHKSLNDVDVYLQNTKSEIDTLLKTNFKQLRMKLEDRLDKSGETVKNRLGEVSKAVAVDNLTVIVSRLEKIQQHMKSVVEYTVQLQQSTGQLHLGLREAQHNLLDVLQGCTSVQCQEVLNHYDIRALAVKTDTSKLPNLMPVVQNVSALLSDNIGDEVRKGKAAFDQLSVKIQDAVSKTVPDIKSKIAQVGLELEKTANNITENLRFNRLQEFRDSRDVEVVEPYVTKYSLYRWYGSIACCCIMLVITLCFTLGFVCGFCGERTTSGYSDSSCSREKGASILLLGVAVIFLTSFCLLIVTSVLFLVGSVAERAVCDTISNSSNAQLDKVVNFFIDEGYKGHPVSAHKVNYLDVISRCNQNATLYKALGLDKHNRLHLEPFKVIQVNNFSEIKDYRERYQVNKKLEEFLHQVNINPDVTILSSHATQMLERLRDTPISHINFSVYLRMDDDGITGLNLMEVSMEIRDKANLLPASYGRIANQLRNIALQLESYQNRLVKSISELIKELRIEVQELQKEVEFNGKDLQLAVTQLLKQAQSAQSFISTKGREELKQLAMLFVHEFTSLMDLYANHVQYQVEVSVGKCSPVSRAYNATVIAVCSEVVQPFNGYWASMGLCSLLCIPGLIFAILLSVLYHRVDPYPGPLADTVRRKNGRIERGSYDNRNGYTHDYSPGCRETIPLSRSDCLPHTLSPESPAYPLFAPLATTPPTAPETEVTDWGDGVRNSSQLMMEYSKPPPYHFPGP